MLSLSKADETIKKQSCKLGRIYFNSIWNFEIIHILLTKVVAIYIRFF